MPKRASSTSGRLPTKKDAYVGPDMYPTVKKPKSLTGGTKPQSEMSYGELVSKGPGYGSQGARSQQGLTADSNPFQGEGSLGGYFNNSFAGRNAIGTGSLEQQLAKALADISANQNNGGGGTITQTGGSGGGSTATGGGSSSGSGGIADSSTYHTYGEAFGGGPSSNFGDTYGGVVGNSTLYAHPDVLAADLLASMGITNPEMVGMLANSADLGYYIDLIAGGNPSATASTNFVADYLNQMMTPGGSVPTFEELTNLLLSGAGGAGGIINDPNTSAQDINSYIMKLLQSVGGNPLYQRAMSGQNDANQRAYYSDQAHLTPDNASTNAASGSYAEMLRNRGIYG